MKVFGMAIVVALSAAGAGSGGARADETLSLMETRVFRAPIERVWQAWGDSDDVKAWWGPHGFSVPIADMDFRVGGASLVCMQPEGGPKFCNTWRYRTLDAPRLIEFDMGWADEHGNEVDPAAMGLPPDLPRVVPHRIVLEDLGDGTTRMEITEFGYTSEQTVAISRSGLLQVLEKMAVLLGGAA